jgi:hypothetical protein
MVDLNIPNLTTEQLATRKREESERRKRCHYVETEHITSRWCDYHPEEEKLPRTVLYICIRVDVAEVNLDMSVPELRYALDVLRHEDMQPGYQLPPGLASKTQRLEDIPPYDKVGLVTDGKWKPLPLDVDWDYSDLGDHDEAGVWHDTPNYPTLLIRTGYRLLVDLPESIGKEFMHHLEEQLKEVTR